MNAKLFFIIIFELKSEDRKVSSYTNIPSPPYTQTRTDTHTYAHAHIHIHLWQSSIYLLLVIWPS